MYSSLLGAFFLAAGMLWSSSIFAQENPDNFLSPHRINISLNTYSSNTPLPSFETFLQDNTYASPLLPSTLDTFSIQEFELQNSYYGLMINFVFSSKLFPQKTKHTRDFFTAAFETGESRVDLYRLALNDSTGLAYSFTTDLFRISLGYRRWFFKKNRRVQLYSGLEWVSEFNIAAVLLEQQFDIAFEEIQSERKLFGQQLYRAYVNVPLGIHLRLIRNSALFFHTNLAIGSQNIDPFTPTAFYSGVRLGLSLKI